MIRCTILAVGTTAALGLGVIAFHPGVAALEPRLTSTPVTPLSTGSTYTIDPMHSHISFEVTRLGLSRTHGRINKFTGTIRGYGEDLTKASVEFVGEVGSIDTAIPARDEHLRKDDIFDVEKYPTMTFKSTKVEKRGDGYVVTGNLTIKGKTKEIAIPFKHYGPLKLTVGDMKTRIGIVTDPVVIKRSDFGVGTQTVFPDGTVALNDDVTIRISFEALEEEGG